MCLCIHTLKSGTSCNNTKYLKKCFKLKSLIGIECQFQINQKREISERFSILSTKEILESSTQRIKIIKLHLAFSKLDLNLTTFM